jgi:phosphatidate cytidylyltransferase
MWRQSNSPRISHLWTLLVCLSSTFVAQAHARTYSTRVARFQPSSTAKNHPLLDQPHHAVIGHDSLFRPARSDPDKRRQPTYTASIKLRGGSRSSLSSFKERTISTILVVGMLIFWLDSFREKGLVLLVLMAQVGMYGEGTEVVLTTKEINDKKKQSISPIQWWWFIAYELALLGPRLLATKRDGSLLVSPSSIYLCSFAMVALGIMSFVIALNNSVAFSYEFQVALKELALYHVAIILLIVPSSFLIGTIQDFGMNYALYSLCLVTINDIMAYISGVCFGKHPILPAISPKKTWEGFLGALIATMAASVPLWQMMDLQNGIESKKHALVIAAYSSIVAPFGGFLASIVKRAYGKKDFSDKIRGHGGLVDRLDCQLIAAPFVYLYLKRFVLPWKH